MFTSSSLARSTPCSSAFARAGLSFMELPKFMRGPKGMPTPTLDEPLDSPSTFTLSCHRVSRVSGFSIFTMKPR